MVGSYDISYDPLRIQYTDSLRHVMLRCEETLCACITSGCHETHSFVSCTSMYGTWSNSVCISHVCFVESEHTRGGGHSYLHSGFACRKTTNKQFFVQVRSCTESCTQAQRKGTRVDTLAGDVVFVQGVEGLQAIAEEAMAFPESAIATDPYVDKL